MNLKVREKVQATAKIETFRAALRAPPAPVRAEVVEDALPSATEQDVNAIMQQTRITATVTPAIGSVLNVGDDFTLDVTVRNCSIHNLRGAELVAEATSFASVVGTNVVPLGDLTAGEAADATFRCQAIAQTPSRDSPANPLINLSVRAVLDFRSFKSQRVLGAVLPD